MNEDPIVVSGMHRSGTTFTGKVLAALPQLSYVHEPFNPHVGIRSVEVMFPIPSNAPAEFVGWFSTQFDRVVRLRARHRRTWSNDRLPTSIARMVTGGEAGITQWKARTRPRRRLLIKDPYLAMALPWLAENKSVRSVLLVRHPMAIWHSTNRMGWKLDLAKVGGPALAGRLDASTLRGADWSSEARHTRHAALWQLLYHDVNALPSSVLLVKHESLSTTPEFEIGRIADHLGLEIDRPTWDLVESMTTATTVNPTDSRLHHLERNSASMAWSWTDRPMDDTESEIHRITGEATESIYGQWRPPL